MSAPSDLSVVVPTLDEADAVGALLGDLAIQRDVHVEVVVADGGSTDDTVSIAIERDATVITAPRGRASQMNAGADVASADWLLFLHADSRLRDPATLRRSLDCMVWERRGSEMIAGHFGLRFSDAPRTLRYRFLEAKTRLNRPYTIHGDQGFFVARATFQALGGFDETLPFLEDERFAAQVQQCGRWVALPDTIETSARRFQTEGFARRYFVMSVIMAAWHSGTERLLEQTPALYPAQPDAQRLDLSPVFHAIRAETLRLGPDAVDLWEDVGRFACENAWQPFFALDVLVDDAEQPDFLTWYDAVIAGRVQRPWAERLVGMLAFGLVVGVLPEWFRWRESSA